MPNTSEKRKATGQGTEEEKQKARKKREEAFNNLFEPKRRREADASAVAPVGANKEATIDSPIASGNIMCVAPEKESNTYQPIDNPYENDISGGDADTDDEESVASCDVVDDEPATSDATSRTRARAAAARTTTSSHSAGNDASCNGNDEDNWDGFESAIAEAGAASTAGSNRRDRPPRPPVLSIGPTIDDITLQRLGKSCPVVKRHFDAAANEAYDAIKTAVTDVTSDISRYLIDRPKNRGKTAHIYAVLRKHDHSVKKFGLTRHLDERIKAEYDKDDRVYVVSVFNFDAMQPEMDAALRDVLNDFLDTVIDDEEAESFSRRIFKIIRDDGLGRAGAFKRMALALCERGIQIKMGGAGQVCECIMNDIATRNKREEIVRDIGEQICSNADEVYGPRKRKVKVGAICSWATPRYPDNLSSKIIGTESLLTLDWVDTIPEPLFPNPKNMDEAFSNDFNPEQRAGARSVMRSSFERAATLQDYDQLLYVDRNRSTAYPNTDVLLRELVEDFGFELRMEAFDEDLYVLTNHAARSVIIVHGPLCICGDARPTTEDEEMVHRGMTLACMELVKRYVANEDTDAPLRALAAVAVAEHVHRAQNLGCRLRAATYRLVVNNFFINAITDSNLQMHPPDPNFPLSLNSRYKYYYDGAATIEERRALVAETSLSSRVHATTVVDDAISILTRAGPEYLSCVPDIDVMFKTVGDDPSHGVASKRWSILFSLFEEGSPPRKALAEERATKLLKNSGNAKAHHTAREVVDENCRVFRSIMDIGIGSVKPKKVGLFWLPDDERPIPDDMPTELPMSPYTLSTTYPVFRMKFQAVNTRLNKPAKRNTNAHKAIRWEEDLDDGIIKTKRKISTVKKSNYKGGTKPIFTRKYEDYVYRLCYLEVDKILTDVEKE